MCIFHYILIGEKRYEEVMVEESRLWEEGELAGDKHGDGGVLACLFGQGVTKVERRC